MIGRPAVVTFLCAAAGGFTPTGLLLILLEPWRKLAELVAATFFLPFPQLQGIY